MKFNITGKSLNELYKEYGQGPAGFYSHWWKDEKFADDKPEAGEYEIDFDNIQLGKTFEDQKKKIKKGFEVVHPAVLAEAILGHYKKKEERLCENYWLRTSILSFAGNVSCVGDVGGDGLVVSYWLGSRVFCVGVGASRKLKTGKLDTLDSLPFDSTDFETRIKSLEDKMDKISKFLILE